MTSSEKTELLRETIEHLYGKEGRSISYISRLLRINRKMVSDKIKEWKLPVAEPVRHLNPSTQKFLNKNRNLIKSRLDNDVSISAIARELSVSRGLLNKTVIPCDDELRESRDDYERRIHENHVCRVNRHTEESILDYNIEDCQGEIWMPILGYDGYEVSNFGRVKHLSKRYKRYHLVKSHPNKNNGRLYVSLFNKGKGKNIQIANLVANTFVCGKTPEKNTVNHKDGDIQNNRDSNLEWTSQSENNTHSYRALNRMRVSFKRYKFDYILYQGKYQFKTVAAFARFIGKSETQTRRYLDNPSEHEIQFINNCND